MSELFSQEAEQSVIGALLLRPELIDIISTYLVAEDFYYSEHSEIYRTILNLYKKNIQIDIISVAETIELLRFSNGEVTNPLIYLAEIAKNTPSVVNAKLYADIVRERSVCREIEKLGLVAREIAISKQDLPDKISLIQSKALSLDSATTSHDVVHASDVLVNHVEELQRRFDQGGQIDGLSTGLSDLDDKLMGLKAGELIVIAARPSMGKTVLAMNIATHNAIHANKSTLIVSLEMTNDKLMDRALASVGSIPLTELKTGQAACNYPSQLASATNLIATSKLYMADRPNINIMQLRSIARRHKLKHGLDLLVIDYLQLMQGTEKNENRATEVSEMSRQCKLIARELNIPVILLSQLNRQLEQRANKRPILSDLRESGAIEQDADVIIFLYRDEVYNKENSRYKGIAEAILGKYRDGESTTVFMTFNGAMSRFDLLAKGWQPDPEDTNDNSFSDRYRGRR
ncbi:replicative DNA helicase [Entomomonas asaccharolytica]|uniref:Replicative DNA helicase n=1 Tax=Entomomonas asaccharolytica TaxID=2785331 RepID=A0A974NEA1_9GAMM|nr:replicative DNA helicase [Entomomonas asaccharolytica]QQP85093.1 replicative DNA helicase [Entomomonas asaccharolytica]